MHQEIKSLVDINEVYACILRSVRSAMRMIKQNSLQLMVKFIKLR